MFKQSVCVIAILTFPVLSSTAQTQKGSLMLGGSVLDAYAGSAPGSGGTTFGLTANIKGGYFVADRFAIGVGLQGGVALNGFSRMTTYGVQPFARYYFGRDSVVRNGSLVMKKLRFFGEADIGYRYSAYRFNGVELSSNSGMSFGLGGGMNYFIAPGISLEATLKMRGYNGFNNLNTSYRPEFGIGLNIFLPRRSKKIIGK